MLVIRANLARSRSSTLLVGAVACIAAGALCSASLAQSATERSFRVEAAHYDLPDLLVGVPANALIGTVLELKTTGDFARFGTTLWQASGIVGTGPQQYVQADLVAFGQELPPWARLVAGSSPGEVPASEPAAYVERGAASFLHLHAGSEIKVFGPMGEEPVAVAGVVRDMSTESYPFFSNPAQVYLNPAAADAVGLVSSVSTDALFGAWFGPRTALAQAESTEEANLPPGVHYALVKELTSGTVSTVVNLVAGILLAFALLALAAMAFLVGGAVRLEVLRSERRSGQLRALGWTVRGLRTALLAERIPVLVIGASAGSAVGYFVGPKLVEPLTDLYGAYPAPWRPLLVAFAVGAVVVLVASGMVIWCTRHLGKRAVSAQLKALSADRPARLLGRSQLGGAVARFGLAAVAGRKRRAAAVALVTLLASTVVVSGAVIYGAVAQVTHDPAMWGFHYDYRVQLPSGTSLLTAFEQVSALPGVKVASVALSGDAMLSPPTGPTVPFELVSSPSMVQPPVVAGGAAQGGLEVEIGKQVANEMGAKPGSVLQIGPGWWAGLPEQEVPVRVAGVVQDIEDNGNILLGSTYLVGDLGGDVSSEGVLVRCAAASTCPAVGQELASVSRGAWAITSARAGTVLPFAASVEDVSLALSLAFALLACAGSLFSGLVTSAEMAPAYGLLRAIGAKPRQLVATVAVQVGVMAGPALVVGLCAGFPLAHLALAQATKSIGGLRMGTPFGLLALGLLVVAAASGLGLGVPLARAAMRQPVRSIGLDR